MIKLCDFIGWFFTFNYLYLIINGKILYENILYGGIRMVTNNLLIKLKERSDNEIEKVKDLLLSMDGKIPALISIKVETDIRGPEKSSYDIMLITQFYEFGDLNEYLNHPVHIEVSEYIKKVMDIGASLCYES